MKENVESLNLSLSLSLSFSSLSLCSLLARGLTVDTYNVPLNTSYCYVTVYIEYLTLHNTYKIIEIV